MGGGGTNFNAKISAVTNQKNQHDEDQFSEGGVYMYSFMYMDVNQDKDVQTIIPTDSNVMHMTISWCCMDIYM